MRIYLVLMLIVASPWLVSVASGCLVQSELLKRLAKTRLERLIEPSNFEKVYWPREPISLEALSKILSLNVTKASTKFELQSGQRTPNDIQKPSLIEDLFISCSPDRDQTNKVVVNIELDNPFKSIDIVFEQLLAQTSKSASSVASPAPTLDTQASTSTTTTTPIDGSLSLRLPDSSFLVQLSQNIEASNSRANDGCLDISYVQLSPNIMYELDCHNCNPDTAKYLDTIFAKRMNQLDAQLDSLLSEKLLFGLKTLLSEQKLDLEL